MKTHEVIELLESMMPDDEPCGDFDGTDLYDAIEYGEKKQMWRERLVYIRVIDELKDKL